MSANLKNFMKETSVMDSSKGAITTQTNPVAQDDASLGVSLDVSPKKFSSLKRSVNMILGDSLTHSVNIGELERVTGRQVMQKSFTDIIRQALPPDKS